jgi:magnesium transporter
MITHYFRSETQNTLCTIQEPRSGVWTHVVEPSDEELASLIELYGLDDAIIEDIKDVFEVPRFEQESGTSYFFTRYPYDVKDFDIDTAPILFIIGETFLITIAEQEVPFLDLFIEGKRGCVTTNKTELFLEFLSELMVTYERKLARIRKRVYRDMGRIRDISSRDIQRLVFMEQELNETTSALTPMQDWLQHLTKGNYIQMFRDDRELLEDLLIANAQLVDSTKSILKTIQNIRTASEAILTQNLNATIRRLTAFTIVLTIPTLISSVFGMNVPLPLQENPHAGLYIGLFIITAVAGVILFFRHNRWI